MVQILGDGRLNTCVAFSILVLSVWPFGFTGYCTEALDCKHVGRCPFLGPWEVWREQAAYSIGDWVVSSPLWHDNKVYIATIHGSLLCFQAGPRLLWEVTLDGRVLSPLWADPWDGYVYVTTTSGQLYQIAANGKVVAQRSFDTAIVSGVISSQNYIYFGDWEGTLYCLTKKLEPVWSYTTDYIINAPPSLTSKGNVIATSMDGFVYCLSKNGQLLWKFNTGDAIFGSAAVDEKVNIYVGSHNGTLYALDSEGKLKWSFQCLNQIVSTPAIDEQGNIYFGSIDGYFYVVKPDGTLKWKEKRPCGFLSSPILDASGDIYWVSCNAVERRSGENGRLINGFAMPKGESLFTGRPIISEEGYLWIVSVQGIIHILGENRNAFVIRGPNKCDLVIDDYEHGNLDPLVGGNYTFDSDERHHPGVDPSSYCTFNISTTTNGNHYLTIAYKHTRWLKAVISLPRLNASGYDGIEFTMWASTPTTLILELGVFSPSGQWRAFTARGIYLDEIPKRYRVEFSAFAEGWSDKITGVPPSYLRNLVAIGLFPQNEIGKLFLDDVCLYKKR